MNGAGERIGFAERGHYDRELYDAAQTPRSKYEGYDLSIGTNEEEVSMWARLENIVNLGSLFP